MSTPWRRRHRRTRRASPRSHRRRPADRRLFRRCPRSLSSSQPSLARPPVLVEARGPFSECAAGLDASPAKDRVRRHQEQRKETLMSVPTFQDLPLADRDRAWDGDAAEKRVRKWAGAEDEPNARYRDAHAWYDSDKPENFGSYKLL